jgi:hypothetical protein
MMRILRETNISKIVEKSAHSGYFFHRERMQMSYKQNLSSSLDSTSKSEA